MIGDTNGVEQVFVRLDSGVVCRVIVSGRALVAVTPRSLSGPPIGAAPILFGAGLGDAYLARAGGDYRVEVLTLEAGEASIVRIFRDAADSASAACVRNPRAGGCRSADAVATRPASISARPVLAAVLFAIVAAVGGL